MEKVKYDKKTSELKIKAVAEKKEWKEQQDKAFKDLAKNTEIKGFRKGHVPAEILKKNISQQEILAKAINGMLSKLAKEASDQIPEDLMILDSPTYSVEKISDAELELTFIYPVYPEFDMPDYKNLGIKYEEKKISKKDVDAEIEKLLSSRATLEVKDGQIEKGDTAVFDFTGKVNDVEFEGGKAEKYPLEIGSGQFIPGFEDQMIGLKVGDEKDVKVKFPDEYHSEDLKGKDAVFEIKVHEIKAKAKPELNDEFISSLGIENVKTVKEFEEYLTKVMSEQAQQVAKSEFQQKAFDLIKTKVEINLPAQLVASEMSRQRDEFNKSLSQHGQSMEQYIQMTGATEESMNSEFKKQAVERLTDSLLFAELAKLEKIEIKEDEYDEEYKKLAKVYGQSEDSIKNVITRQQMQIPMTNDRVVSKLIEYNK